MYPLVSSNMVCGKIWKFPKMGLPGLLPKSSKLYHFSIETHGFGGPPFYVQIPIPSTNTSSKNPAIHVTSQRSQSLPRIGFSSAMLLPVK